MSRNTNWLIRERAENLFHILKEKQTNEAPTEPLKTHIQIWFLEGFPEEEKFYCCFFFSWTFHWKHLSSLYRNYKKPIKGPKGKGDISSLPVFRSDFLKRRGISVSSLHQKKMYFVLPNFTYIVELLFFMFYTKSCKLHTWKETFLITLELL